MGQKLTWEDFELTVGSKLDLDNGNAIRVSRSNAFAMVDRVRGDVTAYYEIWCLGGDGFIADLTYEGHGGHTLGEFPSMESAKIASQGEFDGP